MSKGNEIEDWQRAPVAPTRGRIKGPVRSGATVFVVAIFLIAGLLRPSHGYPIHRRLFKATQKKSVRCELCHSRTNLNDHNPYGRDWVKHGESVAAFKAIEGIDSDGDGYTNDKELKEGSNPGDRTSVPGKPGPHWGKAQEIPVPTEKLTVVLGDVDGAQAIEPDLTARHLGILKKGAGTKLKFSDKFPTLYFGLKGNRRTSVAMFRHFQLNKERFSLLIGINTSGKIRKVALLRAGKKGPKFYAPYLTCLAGRTKANLPLPGQSGCPTLSGQDAVAQGIVREIKTALWTITALFSKSKGNAG
jgi:hypothetical protein